MKLRVCDVNKYIRGRFDGNFEFHYPSRMWTRGDGIRYKDPNRIESNEETIEMIWNHLSSLPEARHLEVTDEFGSSPFRHSVIIGEVLFKRFSRMIEFQSKSVIRNNSTIWRSRGLQTRSV